MQLQTPIDIPTPPFSISHDDRILLMGSCFADEMGQKFCQSGFTTLSNPFGTLYNPASIAAMLLRCISQQEAKEVFADEQGIWHSWLHHSRFSTTSKAELQERIAAATHMTDDYLRSASVLIVTFGTAIIYRLQETGMLVANCHKQPDRLFHRERLTPYDIADQWQTVLQLLHAINPGLKLIFTVSPIRHKRDGMHVNQISKGILLQAVDELVNSEMLGQPTNCPVTYFPSYELMLDELRDYRFYADDLIHPSALAVEYIWQRFQQTYMDKKTIYKSMTYNKEWRASQHRTIIE